MTTASIDNVPPSAFKVSAAESAVEAAPEATTESTSSTPPSFASVQAVTLPIGVLGMFLLCTIGMVAYNGDVMGAIGLGLYMAFWVGLGFGFLAGGAVWAMRQH